MTNNEFSRKDPIFIKACELASIPTTSRQASKYRNEKGIAYATRREAIRFTKKGGDTNETSSESN